MTDKLDDPDGCPLANAIECTADPGLVRKWKDEQTPANGLRPLDWAVYRHTGPSPATALQIEDQFREKLKTKELRLEGRANSPLATRTPIEAEILGYLNLFGCCEKSMVTVRDIGLTIYDVRVFRGPAPAPAAAGASGHHRSNKSKEVESLLKKYDFWDAANNPNYAKMAETIMDDLIKRNAKWSGTSQALALMIKRQLAEHAADLAKTTPNKSKLPPRQD